MIVCFILFFGGLLFLLLFFSMSPAFSLTSPQDLGPCSYPPNVNAPYLIFFLVFNSLNSKNTFTCSSYKNMVFMSFLRSVVWITIKWNKWICKLYNTTLKYLYRSKKGASDSRLPNTKIHVWCTIFQSMHNEHQSHKSSSA